ncbi:hypothetical protein [Cylindrospermum sp. FACHB-282]|uniref:hypothetical protein n=1 Tax=Cylindrospermum sp. FACHB-282 TaxID=2692794 RepID=UPI001683D584|nr:hypothetical protein [Cylindrospermum sp. FACHB-282]MBD2386047.1 hypothetical protein [Cylindrospermum sp. FACHB-282]
MFATQGLQLSFLDETRSPIEIIRKQPPPHPESPRIFSCGMGRNSVAAIVMFWKLGLKIDLIIFADTGNEKQATYDYIEIFQKWLLEHGMPLITIVRKEPGEVSPTRKVLVAAKFNWFNYLRWSIKCGGETEIIRWLIQSLNIAAHKYTTLEEECLVNQSLPSKAYGGSKCSMMWKIEPQQKYEREWLVENGHAIKLSKKKFQTLEELELALWLVSTLALEFGESSDLLLKMVLLIWKLRSHRVYSEGILAKFPVAKYIGFHVDETHRLLNKATSQMRSLTDGIYQNHYPLMQYGLDDLACQMLIASVDLPVPPKSSCTLCPSSKLEEIRDLDPDDRKRAHLIEAVWENGIQRQYDSSVKGLGRRFSWREINTLSNLEEVAIASVQESRNCHCID